ncbi:MAG: MFS transporter [Halioglobus sp.]|nr:MFS transporter [Halioglobus sp.]
MGIVSLVMAGEAIFSLPFHVVRFFRPTMLEVFQVSNLQIGQVQATYGIVAMLSYFLGGPLADRFEARNLLIVALFATGIGGLYFAQIPDLQGLYYLYAFWGCSTILLFWGALIKATRDWGGLKEQGKAFGFLEAGRGLFAAILVSLAIAILSFALPTDLDQLVSGERRQAMQQIIYLYVATTLLAGVFVALFIPIQNHVKRSKAPAFILRSGLRRVLSNPLIWPQMLIVMSAYVAYKGVDYYVLYSTQGYGLTEIEGANIGGLSSWIRPIAAVLAGLLADRYRPSKVVIAAFGLLIIGYFLFAFLTPAAGLYWVLVINVVITSVAVYALHAIYFALVAESKIPIAVTGTAVGVISVIGFTPDIFMAPGMGWLLDNNTGITGHQKVFSALCAFAILGFVSSGFFIRRFRRGMAAGSQT